MSEIRIWLRNYMTWFTDPLSSITLTNVLEIIILAFLVYSVLLWIKHKGLDAPEGNHGAGSLRVRRISVSDGHFDLYCKQSH